MKNIIRKIMTDRVFLVLTGMVGVIALTAPDAFAQSENIQSSLQRITTWTSTILGGTAILLGIIWTGIKMTMGDGEAMKRGAYVIGGGFVILAAPWILNLLKSFVGS